MSNPESSDRRSESDTSESLSDPDPAFRLVEGVATVDDLDDFLADLRAVSEETGAVVQAFDAELVVSAEHLARAVRLAARAIARGEAVARDPSVEVLLYAAGRRQIDRALTMGVTEGETPVVVLVADFGGVTNTERDAEQSAERDAEQSAERDAERNRDAFGDADLEAATAAVRDLLEPADTLGRIDEGRVRDYFDVTDRELAATDGDLADVVAERVALLDVEK